MPSDKPKASTPATLMGAAAAALAVSAWPVRVEGGLPLPPGYQVHLCDEAARRTSTHCEFGIGAERRLRVPWEAFRGGPALRHNDSRVSTYGLPYPNPFCRSAIACRTMACASAFGRSGRREALPNRHPGS